LQVLRWYVRFQSAFRAAATVLSAVT
jgi:hypothetical protein